MLPCAFWKSDNISLCVFSFPSNLGRQTSKSRSEMLSEASVWGGKCTASSSSSSWGGSSVLTVRDKADHIEAATNTLFLSLNG